MAATEVPLIVVVAVPFPIQRLPAPDDAANEEVAVW